MLYSILLWYIYIYIQYILCNIFAHAVNRFCKVLKLITRVRGRWQVECFYKIIKGPAYPIRDLNTQAMKRSEMLSDGDNESMVLEYTGLHEYLMHPSGHFVNRLWTFCVNGLCCQSKLINLFKTSLGSNPSRSVSEGVLLWMVCTLGQILENLRKRLKLVCFWLNFCFLLSIA